MKRFILMFGALLLTSLAHAITPQPISGQPSVIVSSNTLGAAGIGLVVLSTPTAVGPYSTGYSVYVSHIRIEMYATGTLTGGATPVKCSVFNLPGNPVFLFPTAGATGTVAIIDMPFDNPIQATTANLAVNISCPSTASVMWNIIATYMTGA